MDGLEMPNIKIPRDLEKWCAVGMQIEHEGNKPDVCTCSPCAMGQGDLAKQNKNWQKVAQENAAYLVHAAKMYPELQKRLGMLLDAALCAIDYVGYANYPHRQAEARTMVRKAVDGEYWRPE